jgi:hypothetical protein
MPTLFEISFRRLAGALIVVAICGCGSSSNPATVQGVVKFNGAPLTFGRVLFEMEGQAGKVFLGSIGADGGYEIRESANISGLPPGNYRVSIMAQQSGEMDERGNSPPPVNAVPEKYGNVATSGLTATVTNGKNKIDFDLTP